MLKKILGTIGTRYLIAFLNLALIFVNAKVLGVEGIGLVGLIMASVNIAIIFNGILSGNTIVYFMNRYSVARIFVPAYIWSFIGSAIACMGMDLVGLVPTGYGWDVYLLSVLSSLVVANARFLLGQDRIKAFNLTYMLQGGLLFFVLLYLYYIVKRAEVGSYIWGVYITNGLAFSVSLVLLLPSLKKKKEATEEKSVYKMLKEMFSYGLWASTDNLAEVLTTRLNYFLIQRLAGLGSVGLLDAGTKIAESVWHISRSVSFIEYSSVAKAPDLLAQKRITLQLFKLTAIAMALATCFILLIPEWVYTDYLFSSEFVGMRKVIAGLSVGIVSLGCNSILSHFFIGSGRIKYSVVSSATGLVTLLVAGYGLIPAYGVVGSAISSSIAFSAMLLFSITMFCRQSHTKAAEFLLHTDDLRFMGRILKQGFSKKRLL